MPAVRDNPGTLIKGSQPEPGSQGLSTAQTTPKMQLPVPKGPSQGTPVAQQEVQGPFFYLFPSGKSCALGEIFSG